MCNEPEDPYLPPGIEELFATATCAPRESEKDSQWESVQQRAQCVSVRRVTACESQIHMPRWRTAIPGQPCNLNALFIVSHFVLFHPSPSLSFLHSFLRGPIRRRLHYFFIMHTFAGAIAISFGLVSALSARKSIFMVAEHQRKNVGEFSLFFPFSLPLSLENLPRSRKSRAAINLLLKRNRFPPF